MTKDRPRNRPGKGGKSGGFRGKTADGPRDFAGGGPKRHDRDSASERDEKPWSRERAASRNEENASPRFRPDRLEQRGSKPGGHRPPSRGQFERREPAFEENGEVWIWGIHAASAALANPMRKISKAYLTPNAAQRAGLDLDALPRFAQLTEPSEIDQRLPPGAVHQGLAVRCRPLDGADISEAALRPDKPLVILDQVTDPQNVGAVFRSAAAFGMGGVVMQTRNAPALGGALAKAATGAIERVEEIRAVNLSRAIDALRDAGWKVIGLDGAAEQTLDEAFAGDEPLAIVLGAEGAGIRQGVAKACSSLARIPINADMESLNVSNAAAIAFYEAARRHGASAPAPKPKSKAIPADDANDDGFDGEAE